MKADGIWTKMKAIYPFVGGTASTHKYNLKDPRDLDAAFRLVFNGGWTHSSNGALPNGTNGYADTAINNTNLSGTDFSWGFYSRTNSDGLIADLGFGAGEILTRLGNTLYSDAVSSAARITVANANSTGFYSISNNATFGHKVYKNGSNIASGTFSHFTFANSLNMLISAYQESGVIARFSNRQCAFAFASLNLDPTQSTNLYTRVQAYQTLLNRQV
jgi:hypothetical protein